MSHEYAHNPVLHVVRISTRELPSGVTLVYAHAILTRCTCAYEFMSQAILSLSAQYATIKG
jgi:hypothetical protein